MFAIKKCACGAKSFAVLVDTKTYVACTKCGLLAVPEELQDVIEKINFKLSPA